MSKWRPEGFYGIVHPSSRKLASCTTDMIIEFVADAMLEALRKQRLNYDDNIGGQWVFIPNDKE